MYNDNIAIENFITYCDDMMIAEESVFTTIKNGLVRLFTRLVNFLDRQVNKMKDGRLKKILQRLLERAKRGLKISKTMKEGDEETSQELQKEAENIQRESEEVTKNMNNNKNDVAYREDGTILYIKEPNGKRTNYRKDGKTIWHIEEPNGKVIWYRLDGKTIDSIKEPNGKVTFYYEDGKTIWYIKESNGKVTEFDKNGKEIKD